MTIEISVASSPTNSEIREPQISRVRMERPFSSVPSRKSPPGRLEHAAGRLGDLETLARRRGAGRGPRPGGRSVSSTRPNRPERWLRKLAQVRRAARAAAGG